MNTSLTNSSFYLMDPLLSASTSLLVICYQMINVALGIPLNSYILFLLFTRDGGIDMFTMFVMNQAISEILLCLAGPLSILCHVNIDLCYSKPLGFLWGLSMCARVIFQCCVCLERYLAVVHPITFLQYSRGRYWLSCSLMAWTVSLACSIMFIFRFPKLPYNFLGVFYCIILILELFCCLSILEVLRRPKPSEIENERDSKDTSMNTVKKKAFKIVLINLMTFLMQSIPISVTFILRDQFISLHVFNLAVAICLMLNFAAGFVQPVFFLHKVGKLTCLRCS